MSEEEEGTTPRVVESLASMTEAVVDGIVGAAVVRGVGGGPQAGVETEGDAARAGIGNIEVGVIVKRGSGAQGGHHTDAISFFSLAY